MAVKGIEGLYKAVRLVCNVLLALQAVLVCYIVFTRFVLNNSPAWGEELALLFMVWFCLLSPAEALRDDRHLNIALCRSIFPGPLMKVVEIFNHLLILSFAVFMVVEGTRLSILTSRNILPGMGVPATVMYASLPVSGLCIGIAAVGRVIEIIKIPGRRYLQESCAD